MKWQKRVGLFFLWSILHGGAVWALSSEDEDFVRSHTVPEAIKEMLDSSSADLKPIVSCFRKSGKRSCKKKFGHLAWQIDALPDYYIKYGVGRVKGRERVVECIKRNKLDLLTVPEKYLYHIPGKPHTLNNYNYLVIAQKIVPSQKELIIGLDLAKQLSILICETGYADASKNNLIRISGTNKVAIIDTEEGYIFKQSKVYMSFRHFITDWLDKQKCTREGLDYFLTQFIALHPQEDRHYGFLYKKILEYLEMIQKKHKKFRKLATKWIKIVPKPLHRKKHSSKFGHMFKHFRETM